MSVRQRGQQVLGPWESVKGHFRMGVCELPLPHKGCRCVEFGNGFGGGLVRIGGELFGAR